MCDEDTTTYTILVKTCEGYDSGGTHSTVEIQLIGKNPLKNCFKWMELTTDDGYGTGTTIVYKLVGVPDVGMPCAVRLKITPIDGEEKDPWCLDYLRVDRGDESKTFPVYTFISGTVNIIDGDTQLPQKVTHPLVKRYRNENIRRMQKLVQWVPTDQAISGMMRFVNAQQYDDLPNFMKKYKQRQRDFTVGVGIGVGISYAESHLRDDPKSLNDYHKYHKKLDVMPRVDDTPGFLDDWDTDESFSWQMLNGMLPFGFKKLKTLEDFPTYFNVTDDDLVGLLGDDKTIKTEIEAGKLYITDYSEIYEDGNGLIYTTLQNTGSRRLDGTQCDVAPAICLFHVNHRKFVPLAIQLEPKKREYVFIAPKSDENNKSWLLAKMYFRNAGFSIHEWIYHFLYTHATVEVFQVAAYRQLSSAHPVYKLLRPHVRTVAAINADARDNLIPYDSIPSVGICTNAESMVSLFYKNYFSYENLTVPKALEKHDINPDEIPSYFYGRDTLELWGIVGEYVKGVINVFYESDQDVIDDDELKEFANELAFEGFGWEEGDTKGMPEKFETRKELIDLCTFVICTSSVQHAAVNFGQYESGKFVPNFPSIMNLPAHTNDEVIDDQRILDSLPKPKQVWGVIAILYALSTYSGSEVEQYLGDFGAEEWFFEEQVKKVQKKFHNELDALDKKLRRRNRIRRLNGERPYIHQRPRNIPNSIAI